MNQEPNTPDAVAKRRLIPGGEFTCVDQRMLESDPSVLSGVSGASFRDAARPGRLATILAVIAALILFFDQPVGVRLVSPVVAAQPQLVVEDLWERLVSGEVIDDALTLRRLTEAGGRLVESGKAAPMGRLASQLGRRKCSLELPLKGTTLRGASELAAGCRRAVCVVGRLYKFGEPGAWRLVPASGFFISRSGALLTSRHVVNTNEFEALVVLAGDGRVLPVLEVLASDPISDVAIVQVGGAPVEAIPLECRISAGISIGVMSHPVGRFYTFTSGVVTRRSVSRIDGASREIFEISADFGPGSSGAPVMNGQGNAVGWVDSLVIKNNGASPESGSIPQLTFRECGLASDILRLIEDRRETAGAKP